LFSSKNREVPNLCEFGTQQKEKMNEMQSVFIPGDLVGNKDDGKAGRGTYLFQKHEIRSSVVGMIVTEKKDATLVEADQKGNRSRINVISEKGKQLARNYVLNVDDVVYAKVVRTNYNQAYVDIICIGDIELPTPLKGVIRKEDIRETEIDKVIVQDFFKAMDIVRAVVVSLGDSKFYFLSTAKSDMGVVLPKGKDKFI
jgi:exosome complex component CSL4